MKPKLSICIPTYNRAPALADCLASIFKSARSYEEQIEVVIADNASEDKTLDVVTEFQKLHSWIQYRRNRKNIGAARNIYNVIDMAAGEYIWVIGDDDKMTSEAIPRVFEYIEADYNLIITNFSHWVPDFSRLVGEHRMPLNLPESINDANQLMECFGLNLGYISSCIIRASTYLSTNRDECEQYLTCGFPHLFSIYSGILKECRVRYISDDLICNRTYDSGGYDWYDYVVTGSSRIFDALLEKGYSARSIKTAKQAIIRDYIIHNILVRKRTGKEVKGLFSLMKQYYQGIGLFWYKCVPALLIPPLLARGLYKVKRLFKKSI